MQAAFDRGFVRLSVMSKLLLVIAVVVAVVLISWQVSVPPGSEVVQAAWADIQGHWAEPDIQLLRIRGAVDAYPDGSFRPDQPLSRAELVHLLVSAFGYPHARPLDESDGIIYPEDFYDVQPDHWVQQSLHTAVQFGLVRGYPDGSFAPQDEVTRAELASMLYRLIGSEVDLDLSEYFEDSDRIPDWADEAVRWAAGSRILQGFPDDTFRSTGTTTRAQAAAVVRRALDLNGELFDLHGQVRAVSPEADQILLDIAGDQLVGLPVGEAQIYRGGEAIGLSDLMPLEHIQLALDEQGEVRWVESTGSAFAAVLQEVDYDKQRLRVSPVQPTYLQEGSAQPCWDGAAYWAGTGKHDQTNLLEDEQYIYWSDGSQFFRQGDDSDVDQLRPGDRLYLTLAGGVPLARTVDAVSFDSWGRIEELDPVQNVMRWEYDGETSTGQITANSTLTRSGERIFASSLTEGEYVGVVFSADGEMVIYAEVFDETPFDVELWDRWVSLPVATAEPDESRHPGERQAVHPKRLSDISGYARSELPDTVSQQHPSNSEIIGASDFRSDAGVTGTGVTVAVVDTGIDPGVASYLGHDGGARLADWTDFTGGGSIDQRAEGQGAVRYAEGDVRTDTSVTVVEGKFAFDGREFEIEGAQPADGQLRCGWLHRSALFEGDYARFASGESVLVAAARTKEGGSFDAVYVDEEGDGVLREWRTPWRRGDPHGSIEMLRGEDVFSLSYVVADVSSCGRLVNLGYDTNGHGTQVASVIAGLQGPTRLEGVAPHVELMSLKALDSRGSGSWNDVIEAVRYAALRGADIVNVSVTGVQDLSSGASRESRMLREISLEHDVLIITAVGNRGPGLATTFTPGDPRVTLAVGAASIPEVVLRDYGYQLSRPVVWQHSSVGPRADGGLGASILGPASSQTAAPGWMAPQSTAFFEGTSCAAAHVSGAAALILERARLEDIDVSLQHVKQALEDGAVRLRGFMPIEQGYGLLDVQRAWDSLRSGPQVEPMLRVDSGVMVERPAVEQEPRGVYLRESTPGGIDVTVTNPHDKPRALSLSTSNISRVELPLRRIKVPGHSEMSVPLRFGNVPEGSTLSGFLTARSAQGEVDGLLHTLIRPYRLDSERPVITSDNELGPGQWERYFLQVPEGASALEVDVEVPGENEGRVTFQLVNPEGKPVFDSHPVGSGAYVQGGRQRSSESAAIRLPQPGVWEVTVVSAPSLSFYGLESSRYELKASVLPEDGLLLSPPQTEHRWSYPEEVPDYLEMEVSVRVDDSREEGTLPWEVEPFGMGWVSERASVEPVARQWLDAQDEHAEYLEFEVPPGTDTLLAFAHGEQNRCSVSVSLHRSGSAAEDAPLASGDGFLMLKKPEADSYMLKMDCPARDCNGHEVTVYAWPDTHDFQVSGPSWEGGHDYNLTVRSMLPRARGDYWAMVGLRDSDGEVIAFSWLYAEIGSSDVVFSPAVRVSAEGLRRITVLDADTLRPAEGVVLSDQRLYTVSERGTVKTKDHPQDSRASCVEVRFNSGSGEWSTPVKAYMPAFSQSEILGWDQGLGAKLAAGDLHNPVIFTRLTRFLSAR